MLDTFVVQEERRTQTKEKGLKEKSNPNSEIDDVINLQGFKQVFPGMRSGYANPCPGQQ